MDFHEEEIDRRSGETEPENPARRRLLRAVAGGAGVFALTGGVLGLRGALAKNDGDDDDDDDNSGPGGGGDDHSGHGGGDDEIAITGTIPAGSVEVWIDDDDADAFEPGDLTVDLGQSVTFINADKHRHTATGSGFDTGIIEPGATATVVLDTPGRFAYACRIHPVMTGTISVQDENGQVPERAATPAASPQASPAAGSTEISIENLAYNPPSLEIPAGTTVTWTNRDPLPHTATANVGSFNTGQLDLSQSASQTFDTPGTYAYGCGFHPDMAGEVIVT
jgi:plastocyanin